MEMHRAAALAQSLLAEHALTGWTFAFDRARVRAGACHYDDRLITLSPHLTRAHDQAQVRETLLHEIAHALVGPGHGHDEVWRARALAIGSTGRRCYAAGEDPAVPGRWQGRCVAGHVVHRHRRPTRVLVCTRCRGRSTLDRVLRWTHDGVPVTDQELGPQMARVLAQLRAQDGATGQVTGRG
ncbi:SprT-like domain-containing protein [Ornithinimicrobium pratense]|uniref:SprT domain-containing protein n=1 Tax=Ornithinimicrobium pratense TaxID=2593973 RepID=A0A5J6V3C7_9MICO|nr:SprT-like domain-containing protein [Ornithinimicrobium pratense]QFG67453.1 sprT domain-containing protein [Ornithinimicrobium pratense]